MAVNFPDTWLWLIVSLALATLWTNVAWLFGHPQPGRIGQSVGRLRAWRFAPWLLQFLRLLYYVGLPFAALLWGRDAVTRRFLGLQSLAWPRPGVDAAGLAITTNWLDWTRDAGWAAALGVAVLVFLALGWAAYRRALRNTGLSIAVVGTDVSAWVHLREAALHEVHWAFYRNAPILALGADEKGIYLGAWLGLALVGLEAVLNPAWRDGLMLPERAPAQLMRAALAVASTILFWKTGNLWLAIGLHFPVSLGLAALARASAATQVEPVQTDEPRSGLA